MGRVFGFNWDRSLASKAEGMEAMRESLIDNLVNSERGQETGVTREGLENISRFNRAQGHDEPPTHERGVSFAPARVRNEDGFQLESSHTNAHGDRMITAYRPIGGGRFERVRIRESQAGERTRIVSEFLGGR